jgi:hypothetical protein
MIVISYDMIANRFKLDAAMTLDWAHDWYSVPSDFLAGSALIK